ncbi:MAG: NAD+ synthase [Planctomycetes bacterium]|jgi:NAD+ synthase (glutamine-hydrolysing)|nr:NAD+ synthase [Planctomycetota bacterium]
MKIALAQINPVVGDITGNARLIAADIARAKELGASLVVFPELSMVGYPPRDLLVKYGFVAQNMQAVEDLALQCRGIAALVGFVRPNPNKGGRALQNAAALLKDGKVAHVHVKSLLPTYDVFDETRYFEPEKPGGCIELEGVRIGLSICEDLWDAQALGRELYGEDPIFALKAAGAQIIINMSASPYQVGKERVREDLFLRQTSGHGVPILYVNQVGGNDELIFDGCSCAVSAQGKVFARAKSFEPDLLVVDLDSGTGRCEESGAPIARLSAALKLGLGDYIHKCGFSKAVLGLSGGIDSAVVATLAADALGPKNVLGIAMPSRFSSDHSLSDAKALADNLGIEYRVIPIEQMHAAFEHQLDEILAGGDEARQNIQARIRGVIVMAASNALGHMALATGNKSELSCGYCTLYGDMCGGLAPIGDVLKTQVYELARQLNTEAPGERIPSGTFTKPPSAELKPDQTDQDKLPPYDVLDQILHRYVELEQDAGMIIAAGLDAATVRRVIRMVDLAEYKRKQAAPVLKISPRAFGAGRRVPIAQRYTQ